MPEEDELDKETQQKLEDLEKQITFTSVEWVTIAMERLSKILPVAKEAVDEEISKVERKEKRYSPTGATNPEIEGVKGAVSVLEEITELLKKLLSFIRKLRWRKENGD